MNFNVVDRRTETPKLVASVIESETELAWRVGCEGGCGRVIDVSKRYRYPVNFDRPDGDHVQVDRTAPGARRCASCGPSRESVPPVTTYRRRGTFRAQAAERSSRAQQDKPLPPRCNHCRLPGLHRVMVNGIAEFFCDNHVTGDTEWECGVSEDHDWKPGDLECRRCYADLSEWNDEKEEK